MFHTLNELLFRLPKDRTRGVTSSGTFVPYDAIVERACRTATALRKEASSLDGARVAMLVGPGDAFLVAFAAILFAGGTVVVLSPLHPVEESRFFLTDSRAVMVVTDEAHHQSSLTIADGAVPVLRTDALDTSPLGAPTKRAPDDDALQLYTSGTTGKPKGAVLTQRNLATQAELVASSWAVSEADVLLHALPLHHMHGLAIALLTALGRGSSVQMEPFSATGLWDAMKDATLFMAVPTMYVKLLGAFDAADDATRVRWRSHASKLRLVTSGSAALPVTVGERLRSVFGQYPLERFGMTEIGVGLTNPLEGERRPGTVGHPLPTVETRIVNDAEEDAAEGELLVRGPSVFSRYFERDEATRLAFVPAPDGGAPFFRTGDTVTRDGEGGPFRILGRTSVDILKSGGYKLSALEIEEVLREHPAVRDAAVLGLPDETWGDRVVACILAHPGQEADCTAEALRTFAKQKLAPYKVPKEIRLLLDFPRNALGKVVKPELLKIVTNS